jgi:hypothetical protein
MTGDAEDGRSHTIHTIWGYLGKPPIEFSRVWDFPQTGLYPVNGVAGNRFLPSATSRHKGKRP